MPEPVPRPASHTTKCHILTMISPYPFISNRLNFFQLQRGRHEYWFYRLCEKYPRLDIPGTFIYQIG